MDSSVLNGGVVSHQPNSTYQILPFPGVSCFAHQNSESEFMCFVRLQFETVLYGNNLEVKMFCYAWYRAIKALFIYNRNLFVDFIVRDLFSTVRSGDSISDNIVLNIHCCT